MNATLFFFTFFQKFESDPTFSHNSTILFIFQLFFGIYLCMYLKGVAYNWDELLFRKLSFWVWLITRRVTKRDTLELATLWYLIFMMITFSTALWEKFVKKIVRYIWWIHKKSCGGQGTILINKLSNRCRIIDLHTCVHHGHFQ